MILSGDTEKVWTKFHGHSLQTIQTTRNRKKHPQSDNLLKIHN